MEIMRNISISNQWITKFNYFICFGSICTMMMIMMMMMEFSSLMIFVLLKFNSQWNNEYSLHKSSYFIDFSLHFHCFFFIFGSFQVQVEQKYIYILNSASAENSEIWCDSYWTISLMRLNFWFPHSVFFNQLEAHPFVNKTMKKKL